MKCVLPAVNVKLFAKATHCLAKLGPEIYFEPLENGLALKTVNSSRSAYACFMFMQPLFKSYSHKLQDANQTNIEEFRCKVAVKIMLQVFKSLSTIERSVESCDMELDDEACRLIFKLKCRHGITKTHQLTFQECESLQAVYAKDLSPNVLQCDGKLLTDVVANFSPSFEEVTMCVTPCQVILKSYMDEDEIAMTTMRTEMSLNPEEFTDFQVGVDTDVTFSLKDLRAILAFCDVTGMLINMHFEVGGKPLIVSIEEENRFRANFVLATLSDEELISKRPDANKTANLTKSNGTRGSRTSNGARPSFSALKQAKVNQMNQNLQKRNNPLPRSKRDCADAQKTRLQADCIDKAGGSKDISYELSPEIPVQNHNHELTLNETTIPDHYEEPLYKKVKRIFFEPTQPMDEHSLVVLAPDSDDDT